ncbi:MAG TPA: helix-turn-helix domain-containing protein [Steroidobacteraceae bacterium]|jgi:AcrR family transcriptional regulator|nr:helix-turn-helix domain-containing protein [Steroidobacteraceae bacterium]
MRHESPDMASRFSLPVKQSRSQKTRDRLLAAGFKLLRRKDFDQLSVADIARAAGCAVGSFYQRFFDKDQYFFALAEMRRGQSRGQLQTWFDGATLADIVPRAVERELGFVLEHPDFWRAALRRGTTDPAFWEEFRTLGRETVERFVEAYARLARRTLTGEEVERIRFAFQMVRGTLNNTLINQPGPLALDDAGFRRQIERAFRLVAGIDTGAGATGARRRPRAPAS